MVRRSFIYDSATYGDCTPKGGVGVATPIREKVIHYQRPFTGFGKQVWSETDRRWKIYFVAIERLVGLPGFVVLEMNHRAVSFNEEFSISTGDFVSFFFPQVGCTFGGS